MIDVAAARGGLEVFARVGVRRDWVGGEWVEHLAGASAELLNAVGVAVKHFEHGEGLLGDGELLGHVPRGGEGHEGVETDVVLSAEGAGVGQGASGHEGLQAGARFELFDHERVQAVRGCFLHEGDEGFECAEGQGGLDFSGGGVCQAQIGGQGAAQTGDQHASTDVAHEFATGVLVHDDDLHCLDVGVGPDAVLRGWVGGGGALC